MEDSPVVPGYATLMELRVAGWTLAEIAAAYHVSEAQIRAELARSVSWRKAG
ncbi:hypothetical protein [Paeniglutamicibacter cryotolerans]|uniref:Uncharacterized protein (DUF433 family) n=1 Tax=Paeniglutamicibacter cryotolerans TaxID=670079 RepID=A0A839QU65_9MICC|nr:hypothetical protein [Paeniglutamicibacter cryotolerans]MBB2995571.1 uncharacterized protein (DUF433 family) [Paeniglutamicibacter cryotolerans]